MIKKPKISIITAVAKKNNAIGKDNKLLWHIPADLEYFKKTTLGKPMIMGLNTFKSLPGILPGRTHIVLSPDKIELTGAMVATSIEEALEIAAEENTEEVFVIGGGFVYSQFIDIADRLYITLVDGDFEADTFFPDYSVFNKVISEEVANSVGYDITFQVREKE